MFVAPGLCWAVDLRIIDRYESCVVEVAALVGFRIDEEALGATFHI
jgi:hypothetical protein